MTKEKTGHIKILRYLYVIFVFAFGFIAIVGTGGGGGGGGDNSSENGDDDIGIIPLVPFENYVSYTETQSPDTTPGTTIYMIFSTNNEILEGSHWEGRMEISGTYGGGGPIYMESGKISFGFLFPDEPSKNFTSGLIPKGNLGSGV